jgi:hypothetical protein
VAIFGVMTGILDAETSGWTKGFQSAGRDMSNLDKKSKGFFRDLKSNFGKSSTLGQSLKLAAGGGAVGALTAAARQVQGFADELAHMRAEIDAGNASFVDMADQGARALPIIGAFYSAGRSIREAIMGEQSALDTANRETDSYNKTIEHALERRSEILRHHNELIREFADIQRTAEQGTALAGADDAKKKVLEIQFDAENRKKALQDKIDTSEDFKKIPKLQQQLDMFNQSIAQNAQQIADAQAKAAALAKEQRASATPGYYERELGAYAHYIAQLEDQGQQLARSAQPLRSELATLSDSMKKDQAAANQAKAAIDQEAKAKLDAMRAADFSAAVAKKIGAIGHQWMEAAKPAEEFVKGILDSAQRMKEEGKSLKESLRTPTEKYNDTLEHLKVLFRGGNIDPGTLARGSLKALEEYQQAKKPPTLKAVQAEELRGEKYLTAADADGGQKEANALAKKQLEAQLKQLGLTEKQIKAAEQDITVSIP